MSMFHELMMRKKEETLYPVIKGSLTESPSGVFSGFTPTNYLSLDCGTNTINQWEISIDFNYTVAPSSYNGLFSRYSPAFQIYMTSTKKLFVEINGSTDLADFGVLTLNSDYTIKIKYNAGSWDMVLTNKTTGTKITRTNTTSDIWYLSGIFRFGITQNGSYGWDNTINLNTSYLKIGATKYNLQAVVGYTVVGSPTITDGVVSGFSTTDYIQTYKSVPLSTNIEYVTKFRITESGYTNPIIRANGGRTVIKFSILNKIRLTAYDDNNNYFNADSVNTFELNTDYYLKFIINGTNATISISTDGINYTQEITHGFSANQEYVTIFGFNSSDYTHGLIYIKDTLIKINNKLWFNGQQA